MTTKSEIKSPTVSPRPKLDERPSSRGSSGGRTRAPLNSPSSSPRPPNSAGPAPTSVPSPTQSAESSSSVSPPSSLQQQATLPAIVPSAQQPPQPPPDNTASEEVTRERLNWQIHLLYLRKEWPACLKLVDTWLEQCPTAEYPIYVKALIKRHKGEIHESLRLFEQCYTLYPSVNNVKQIARSYFMMGKHKLALRAFEKAEKIAPDDWEIWHNKGMCYTFLKDPEKAIDCFKKANTNSKHEATYIQLGKLYKSMDNYKAAIEVYMEALEFSPENPDLMTTLGLLYHATGENYRAFDYFGNALAQDPTNPTTIMATGSIIQDHSEADVALAKYRAAAVQTPHSPYLWNNVGMCFFGKQKYVAAIACLKKALYYAPCDWIICYNLGITHLCTKQYASAYHFLSASASMRPNIYQTFMYLGITLSRLGDFNNACNAYENAIALEPGNYIVHLNYAITLFLNGSIQKSAQQLAEFEKSWQKLDEDTRNNAFEELEQRGILTAALYSATGQAQTTAPTSTVPNNT